MENILKNLGITELNAMQESALNADASKDLLLLAPTGSGKTLAYLLPLLQSLNHDARGIQALILVPSRELALQIDQVFRSMKTSFKVTTCHGGHSTRTEINSLKEAPDVLIGTPGRINYHLRRDHIMPHTIKTLVLDEFDKSLEWGFQEEMETIIYELSGLNRRILTSATELKEIPTFVRIQQLEKLRYSDVKEMKPNWSVQAVRGATRDKPELLYKLLCYLGDTRSLIFCNHREAVERLKVFLSDLGFDTGVFHGGKEQDDREKALLRFRNGTSRVLISTDLAARGLDISGIDNVIHYQMGDEASYIHRNGRTARMKADGRVFIVLTDEEIPEFADAEILELEGKYDAPEPTAWATVYISTGKKEKVNKGDIAGFFMKKGGLKKEELGVIDVKDKISFAAVARNKVDELLENLKDEKIKNKKVRLELDQA